MCVCNKGLCLHVCLFASMCCEQEKNVNLLLRVMLLGCGHVFWLCIVCMKAVGHVKSPGGAYVVCDKGMRSMFIHLSFCQHEL